MNQRADLRMQQSQMPPDSDDDEVYIGVKFVHEIKKIKRDVTNVDLQLQLIGVLQRTVSSEKNGVTAATYLQKKLRKNNTIVQRNDPKTNIKFLNQYIQKKDQMTFFNESQIDPFVWLLDSYYYNFLALSRQSYNRGSGMIPVYVHRIQTQTTEQRTKLEIILQVTQQNGVSQEIIKEFPKLGSNEYGLVIKFLQKDSELKYEFVQEVVRRFQNRYKIYIPLKNIKNRLKSYNINATIQVIYLIFEQKSTPNRTQTKQNFRNKINEVLNQQRYKKIPNQFQVYFVSDSMSIGQPMKSDQLESLEKLLRIFGLAEQIQIKSKFCITSPGSSSSNGRKFQINKLEAQQNVGIFVYCVMELIGYRANFLQKL